MTPTELLVPSFRQMLGALSSWLDKAGEGRSEADADGLMSARLAPDMFPLATQVRFACAQVHEAVHRLRGETFPPSLTALMNEGREADERPGTRADAKARVDEAVAVLDELSADALDRTGESIAHELANGMIFDLTVTQYVRDWTLPQFYFHLLTAYAILRAEGVPLGKVDYVAHLLPHLRPGTAPSG